MKNLAKMSLVLFGLVFLLSSCEERLSPSGYVTLQQREVSDFDGLEVSTAFEVYVMFTSGDERVEIEADDNLQARILVDKFGSTLRIRIKDGTSISGHPTLKAYISTPTPMKYLAASGATHIRLQNVLETEELFAEISGASSLEGEVAVTDFNVVLTGASSLSLAGSINKFAGSIDGASTVDGFNIECNELDLNLSGACSVSLTVNGSLDLDASGSSILKYRGHPSIRHINLTGSSKLIDAN